MTGFEPRTSGIGSDRSTNWSTTTASSYSFTYTKIQLHRGDKVDLFEQQQCEEPRKCQEHQQREDQWDQCDQMAKLC